MPPPGKPSAAYSRLSSDNSDDDALPPRHYTDELDPLRNPHDLVESDSEDEHWKSEKSQLRHKKRSLSQNESLAYGSHTTSVSLWRAQAYARRVLPPWMLHKRFVVLLAVLVLGYAAFSWPSRRFHHFKPSAVNGESEPWYPSPRGGTLNKWDEAYQKSAALVSSMSLLEKVNITTGTGWEMGMCVGNTGPAPRIGFPSLCLQDGPLGLRFADNITAGPAGVTVGATWNPDLMHKRGRMLGLEARAKGINVLLGPSVGPIGRIPAGGRNWEAFGVDPVLQGTAASMTIRGIQQEGVMATIKHYVANEQEHYRQAWEWGLPSALSSNLDDRTLHEMYAWPFADSIREGVASVMCSYNQVNNSYACQNSKLINGVLKDEMGFQGFVQSDWLAQRSGVASALAGLDMSMPGDGEHWADGVPFWGPHLTRAVLNGTVPLERLDDMVTRIIAAWYLVGQDRWDLPPPNGTARGPNFSSWTNDKVGLIHPGSDDKTTDVVNDWVDAQNTGDFSHSALSRRIAAEGIVLLKNDADFLPLSPNGRSQKDEKENPSKFFSNKLKVAVYGEDAVTPDGGPNVCPDRACNKGTLAMGWGSGAVEFPYLVSPWQALLREFRSLDVILRLWPTNSAPSAERETAPEDQDVCIVFANAAGGEGFAADGDIKGDRNDLRLQKGSEDLIKNVASRCGSRSPNRTWLGNKHGNTIVVIHSIGPVLLESFITDSAVGAVLFANLPGQESGNALADVIFGRVNPSGRLPYTIGKTEKDYGPGAELIYHSDQMVPQQNFTEGLLIDYRWFDTMDISPRFEFGFGMSYSPFTIDDMRITAHEERNPPTPLPPARPPPEREPPKYSDKLPSPSSVVFPQGWRKLRKYIYPYLDSADSVTPDPDPDWRNFPTAKPSSAGGGEGGNPALWDVVLYVDVDVTNMGERAGQTVVQLYVRFPTDVREDVDEAGASLPNAGRISFPPRVLRGFGKVHLRGSLDAAPDGSLDPDASLLAGGGGGGGGDAGGGANPARRRSSDGAHPFAVHDANAQRAFERVHQSVARPAVQYQTGERRTLTFELTRRDLSYWSVARQNWVVPPGPFGIEAGFSSRDIKIAKDVF